MSELTKSVHVLHIDDNSELVDMAAEMVERKREQFSVETATSPSDGLDRLAETAFDCIVSDYQMPGTDGIEFLETVREDHPNLPFILYTGKGSEEVASDAIAAGVTDYLQKQTGMEQYELLANRIENAVEQCRATQRATELERIRDLVADINQALVRASGQSEIDRHVCEIFANSEPYLFTWIGEHDPDTQTIEVRAGAGVEQGYLDDIEITTDDSATSQGPTGESVRTNEISVEQNIQETDEYAPWRDQALERGYRSSIALPLVYEDTLYGVLNVYADRPNAFDYQETEVLAELGDDIANALHNQAVQRTLERERNRFKHLVEGIEHYAIFMLDEEGYVETWNAGAEDIKGYTEAEILGEHYRRFFSEEAVEDGRPEQLLTRAEEEGVVKREDWRVRKDGSQFWADITLTALYNESDNLRGYAKVTQDLTEQRRHQQQLKRQNERLERFTKVVSHDLRNLLNVAQIRLNLVRDEYDNEDLEAAADAVERSCTLIDDLLALARETEETDDVEPVILSDVIKECWPTVDTTDGTLVTNASQTIRADPSQLKQLFENLIRNAVDHGGDDVTVTIGDLEEGFYVADDGPGIPKGERDNVFETGYSTADDGTGLGLTIVQAIADAHGWDIRVTNSEAGGAQFNILGVTVSD
jgi:PAS domain S-box-containing protein